jgi:hypothetical protein
LEGIKKRLKTRKLSETCLFCDCPGLGFGIKEYFGGGPGLVEKVGMPVVFECLFGGPLAEGKPGISGSFMFPEFQVEATGEIPDKLLLLLKQFPEGLYFFRVKFHFNYTVDH